MSSVSNVLQLLHYSSSCDDGSRMGTGVVELGLRSSLIVNDMGVAISDVV